MKKIQREFSSSTSLEKSFDPTIGTLLSEGDNVI